MGHDPLVDNILDAVKGVAPPAPPEPWLAWLVVCLCRQRARQTWLVEVHRRDLAGVEGWSGEVPGLTGWRYDYHGKGLCLTGPGGEVLDMDFHDERGGVIDPYFFANRVLWLDAPPLPEERLRRWLPDNRVMVRALDELRERGIIGHPDSGHVFNLCPALEQAHQEVADLDLRDPAGLGGRLGDDELSGGDAGALRGRYRDWLLGLIKDREQAWQVLDTAAGALPGDEVGELLARIIKQGPVDSAMGRAFELLFEQGGAGAGELDAPELLERLDPHRHPPYPAWAMARYFLAAGSAKELCLERVSSFAAQEKIEGFHGNPYLAELTALMLEHAPEMALPLVRRALRSDTPVVVTNLAALLALLDEPWCHRELVAALSETGDEPPPAATTLVAALGRSSSQVARRRAMLLAPGQPPPGPDGAGYTMREVMAALADPLLDRAMEEARPLAERIKRSLPAGM